MSARIAVASDDRCLKRKRWLVYFQRTMRECMWDTLEKINESGIRPFKSFVCYGLLMAYV